MKELYNKSFIVEEVTLKKGNFKYIGTATFLIRYWHVAQIREI